MVTRTLQQTVINAETVTKLQQEIQNEFLNILNAADFPAILKKYGILNPKVLIFEFRLDVNEQLPCKDVTGDLNEKMKQLQQEIQKKLLKIINQADFPSILAKYGVLNPQVLTFKFRIEGCGPNCLCSCYDEDLDKWVSCPCP